MPLSLEKFVSGTYMAAVPCRLYCCTGGVDSPLADMDTKIESIENVFYIQKYIIKYLIILTKKEQYACDESLTQDVQ